MPVYSYAIEFLVIVRSIYSKVLSAHIMVFDLSSWLSFRCLNVEINLDVMLHQMHVPGLRLIVDAHSRDYLRMHSNQTVIVKRNLLLYHRLSHQNQTTIPLLQGHQQTHLREQLWAVYTVAKTAMYLGQSCLRSTLPTLVQASHNSLLLAAAPGKHSATVVTCSKHKLTGSHRHHPSAYMTNLPAIPNQNTRFVSPKSRQGVLQAQ